MRTELNHQAIKAAAKPIADKYDADVILLNGGIEPGHDLRFIGSCRGRKTKRKNVVLVLITPGGDAHTAYKIARHLQNEYEKFIVFVPGWCKSAGTLLTIGAHELIMTEFSELGPLDVQRGKVDELWEMNSGLIEDAAFSALERAALAMFGDYLMHIKQMSQGRVTFKTASDVAIRMVVGQLQPVYAQIDPLKIGENTRAMQVAEHYGYRLNTHSQNLMSKGSLEALVSTYSSHAFVIDRAEAGYLFRNVTDAEDIFYQLCDAMGKLAYRPLPQYDNEQTFIEFISEEKVNESPSDKSEGHGEQLPPAGHGTNSAGADGAAAPNDSPKIVPINKGENSGEPTAA